ncbi:MAG: EAL domain-containing protein [Sulfurifustis sp.]
MLTPDDVRVGMNRGELFVEYLPTVMLADTRCVGAEALLRWKHDHVVLTGADFIPLIENTMMSGTVTYWVIDTVASELGEWLGAHPDVHVAINVPPEVLGRGGLGYAASRSGLYARVDQIVLEITERGIPDRLGLEALNFMAEHGVRVALDDAMLNGANLALLTRARFSMIKIDRELTAQVRQDKRLPDWLGGLHSLLERSSLQVVAEGVESAYQVKMLRAAGVQMAQGYFFSIPIPAHRLMDFYDNHR